ncbi:LuxR C-terminal-related transcriptional regulator [Vibrio hannami]|uniref:response regulator transcription factor n=1 Tax=Vibrio hannami TaxID=2717094 RepID=UPI0024100316|nr:LuxR C-terminal-related transcriptional regulator [Vibrio hannami]MDG3087999.1 LuxR C-terminal-related transcriptional regulator [Vibrio hannami]
MNLNTTSPTDLVNLIAKVIKFDSIIILGYQNGSHPICLFSSLENHHSQPLLNLLNSSYAFDPFYASFTHRKLEGIYKIEEVLKDKHKYEEYRQQFQADYERLHEIAINLQLDSRRHITVFIRRSRLDDFFSTKEKLILQTHFAKLKTLCRKLWPHIWAATPVSGGNQLATTIHQSLDTFGSGVLTNREQEIASLVIQGTDNKEIANKLGITIATVKAHRKSIYNKLEISSLGDMFQLFLNHLILYSSQEVSRQREAA